MFAPSLSSTRPRITVLPVDLHTVSCLLSLSVPGRSDTWQSIQVTKRSGAEVGKQWGRECVGCPWKKAQVRGRSGGQVCGRPSHGRANPLMKETDGVAVLEEGGS